MLGAAAAAAAVPAARKRATKAIMSLTDTAAARIRHLLSQRSSHPDGIRIGVRRRGCNGLAYTMNYAQRDEVGKFDEVIEDKGVTVFVDAKAVMFLIGTEMDFHEDRIRAEFVFRNPNAKGTCGCGESFRV